MPWTGCHQGVVFKAATSHSVRPHFCISMIPASCHPIMELAFQLRFEPSIVLPVFGEKDDAEPKRDFSSSWFATASTLPTTMAGQERVFVQASLKRCYHNMKKPCARLFRRTNSKVEARIRWKYWFEDKKSADVVVIVFSVFSCAFITLIPRCWRRAPWPRCHGPHQGMIARGETWYP